MIDIATLLTSGSTTVTTVATAAHKSSGSILDPVAKPVAWVLAEIYSVVPNVGLAIIILSILWMVLISPLTLKSTRSMLAMQKLQPLLKKLQEKHKDDRQAFAQAQMDLFREHQVSPFGSCLPMLLPMPVFFALFRVIQGLGRLNPKYLSHTSRLYTDIHNAHGHLNAFGMDLSQKALAHHSGFLAALPFWIALLIMAGTSYFQSAQMMSRNPAAQNNPQMRMMKYLPLLFVLFTINFPVGVIVYYATSNICRIIQQDAMYRFDPKVKALVAQEVEEVETLTHEIDERNGKGGGSGTKGGGGGAGSPKGGGGGAGSPKAGPGSAGASGTGGRTRFRDLLAAAAEQQQKGRPPASGKSGSGSGSTRGGSSASGPGPTRGGNGTGSNGTTGSNGKPRSGNGKGSSAAGGSRSQGGHKTNRKRRGR